MKVFKQFKLFFQQICNNIFFFLYNKTGDQQ